MHRVGPRESRDVSTRSAAAAFPHTRRRRRGGSAKSAGASLLLLPPYSPDYNPIEQTFSKVKTAPEASPAQVDSLFDGIGEALASVTPTDALHYTNHCGYAAR
jgi:transposase